LLSGAPPPAAPVLVAPIGVTTRGSTDIVCVDDPRLAKALRMIREHACDPCDVKQLAARVGVSRRWLEKEFRARYNRSPFDAILRVRMESAKVLLHDPLIPLKRVASKCGYSHPQNFVTAFRKATGETPGQHRRRLVQSI
jgi:LacI family transcriptional regulator